MSPLDLLDRVSSGHLTTDSSPERAPADDINHSLDGPSNNNNNNNAYPTQPIPRSYDLPYQPREPPTTTIPNNDYPPPLPVPSPPTSPPAYRRTPLLHEPLRTSAFPSRRSRARKAIRHWLRLVYLDILLMLIALAATHLVMRLSHAVFRSHQRPFPMTWDPVSEKWYGPPELSYPLRPFVLGVMFTTFIIPAVGVAVLVGMQVFVRSFWDLNAGLFAMFKGLVMMTFIQIFLKQWIGAFRPSFITVCNPVLSPPNMMDPFPFRRFVTTDSCRPEPRFSKQQLFVMQSFPSGHTSESFFLGTFLALYLNAKLKAFSDYHTGFWKWLAVMLPLFGSCLMAGTLVVDRNHHVHDILLSIPWGVLVALLAYRSHYASVFDYRTNHLPLPWSASRRSLHPTTPAPGTERGDNLAAVTWPRERVEHSFDGGGGRRGQRAGGGGGAGLELDGAVERSRRGPGDISRGRLRQSIFPRPTPLIRRLIMRNRSGPAVFVPGEEGQMEFELGEATMDEDGDGGGDREGAGAADDGEPSTARATGHHRLDLEGQRQRRWTLESGEEMD